MKTRIFLDPGHGGADTGCVADNGEIQEATLVLQIAEEMVRLAQTSTLVDYAISRFSWEKLPKLDRARRAKAFRADAALSLHFNAIANPLTNRTDLFSIGKVPPFFERKVLDLGMNLPFRQTSVTPFFYPRVWNCLRHYKSFSIPAVLLEIAFLDRPLTLEYLSDGGVEKIAKSLHNWVEESARS